MKKLKTLFSSISTKLVLLVIVGIIILAASLVVISVLLSGKILTDRATTQMNLFCEERADDIDTEFLRIEDAVGALSRWTGSRIKDIDSITTDKYLRDSIVRDADDLIHFMTEDNNYIQGAYIHYTLDVTGVTDRDEGVYYTRNKSGEFEIIPFTQSEIEKDPVADYWYYGPIKAKTALWTKPYYDESVNDYIISYVRPIFIEETPIAVIGIDISFTKLLGWIDSLRYRETGYMYLKEADGSVHYHVDTLGHEELHSDTADHIVENGDLMNKASTDNELIRYIYNNDDRVMVFVTLRNGMKFVLCDDYDSIYRERTHAIILMISVSVILTAVLTIITVIMVSRITDPLRKLTSAATEISGGNYDVVLPPEKDDEVGGLSKAFRLAIDKIRAREEDNKALVAVQNQRIEEASETLKKQSGDIVTLKNLAYIDSLTKVKNKTAYDDTTYYLDDQIKNGKAEFAVVMCDLNYLKIVNDNYGHQAGDRALKRAAELICSAFPMSSVFRIGGDEFVVIPSGVEYARLDEHLRRIQHMLDAKRTSSDRLDKRISISVGSAVFNPGTDHSYHDVYERADKMMYEEKQRLHALAGYAAR
ncbi:MAG: diguanylate cyclase [Lachnospiraceae bacterium]|nr:diguanylate cyclase [Lachnospiraceae bacterium]